jgi:thiamine transport system ATP-binding protein
MSELRCLSLSATYGTAAVFSNLSLTVLDTEIVSLLGPSGSGKSTLLRIIAGLDRPTAGLIMLDADEISDWPTHRRKIGMVFQDGALFPHMSVADNIGYGLKMQGVRKTERRQRVDELLALIRLDTFDARAVATLSGGEQQRVALARALAPQPRVLLLDEPFSSLDSDLRLELATEVRGVLKATSTTAIIVTHDRDEATRFGDRTVTMAEISG